MKIYSIKLAIVVLSTLFFSCQNHSEPDGSAAEAQATMTKSLRHIVLFKFTDKATPQNIKEVEEAFAQLPLKIEEIIDFEWGLNNSPENLNKGFTHAFLVTFKSENDREVYLVHPDHLKFVDILKPHLDDVLVVDYWAQ